MAGDKIKSIIENSGNDLHQEVVDFLREKGWEVKSSPYYNDPATNKPREIDIIARKKFQAHDWAGDHSDYLAVRLFIECKYIRDSNLIWFENKNMAAAEDLARNNSILRDAHRNELQNTSTLPPKIHHYVRESAVAKRWDKTGHADPLYEAMNGALNGQIFFQEHQYSEDSYPVDFPLIVVNSFDNLHRRDTKNAKGYTAVTEPFQIEVDYSYTNRESKPATGYFLLDVVAKDGLDAYLADLEASDVKILRDRLGWDLRRAAHEQAEYERRRDDNYFDTYSSM